MYWKYKKNFSIVRQDRTSNLLYACYIRQAYVSAVIMTDNTVVRIILP